MAKQSTPDYTPEVGQAFKENLVRLAHEWATAGRQCETFDQILLRAGLPGRPDFHERYDYIAAPPLVGEATVEEFEAWKQTTEQTFWQKADEYGVGTSADDLLEQAGLRRRPAYVDVAVVVEGTFSVPLNITMREGGDVIDHVNAASFARSVYNHLNYGSTESDAEVDWKVRVASEG